EAQDPGWLGGPKAPGEGGAERDGDLAEDGAGEAPPDALLPALHSLGDLDLPGDHREERTLLALVHGVLAWTEVNVGRGLGHPLALGVREAGEQWNRGDVLGGQHGPETLPQRGRGAGPDELRTQRLQPEVSLFTVRPPDAHRSLRLVARPCRDQ